MNTSEKITNEPISMHSQLMDAAYSRWQEFDAQIRAEAKPVLDALIAELGEDHGDVYTARRQWSDKMWSKEQFWAQLDERESVAVLIGNMNYQVENGGWQQWCDNGYVACAEVLEAILRNAIGTVATLEVADMIATVARSWEQFQADRDETPGCAFCRCDDEDECDCESEEDVWQSAHDGFSSVTDSLDTRFYEINDQLMSDVEKFMNGEALEKYSGPMPTSDAEEKRIRCKLIGSDGNAFSVIGNVSEALRRGGRRDLVERFRTEAISGDYNGVLQAAMRYVEVY